MALEMGAARGIRGLLIDRSCCRSHDAETHAMARLDSSRQKHDRAIHSPDYDRDATGGIAFTVMIHRVRALTLWIYTSHD
jgi:hypothetical protein